MKGFWYHCAVCSQVVDGRHKIFLFCFLCSQYRQGSKRKSRPASVKTFEDVPLVTTVKVVQEVSLFIHAFLLLILFFVCIFLIFFHLMHFQHLCRKTRQIVGWFLHLKSWRHWKRMKNKWKYPLGKAWAAHRVECDLLLQYVRRLIGL